MWSTQGAATLDNASPLNAGDIIGTHNGDVTAPTRNGSTDSAWLFHQLDHAPTIKAWSSWPAPHCPRWPPRPTAQEHCGGHPIPNGSGNSTTGDLELSNPVQMVEGTLIVLRSDRNEVTLSAHRTFTATSRPHDERLAHSAAWRGFTITDRRHELDHRNHQVQSAYPDRADTRSQRLS